jgi:hypothetical protein
MMFWVIVIAAWIVIGLAAAPLVFRALSAIDSNVKLDRDGLILAATLGPLPAICLAIPYTLNLAVVLIVYIALGIGAVFKQVFK